MTRGFDEALAEVQMRRKALRGTLGELSLRLSPPQLAEDALKLIDPELSLLGRIKARVMDNKLLSLAVLAGIGWLAGAPRHRTGGPPQDEEAHSRSPRANMKENNNDSGQSHGHDRRDPGAGQSQGQGPEEPAEILARGISRGVVADGQPRGFARDGGKGQPDGGLAEVNGYGAEQRRRGSRQQAGERRPRP